MNEIIVYKVYRLPCVHTNQTFGENWLGLGENRTIQLQCVSIYDHFISLHHYE